jgi:uncharacterized tellurite resistance protein B-like protein
MTNEEIFKDLGEMGTLIGLFIEMARVDGKLDDEEINAVISIAGKFTNQNVLPYIKHYSILLKTLGQKRMYEYMAAGLTYFADSLDHNTKIGVLSGLNSIAHADGVLDLNEKKLFDLAVNLLEVE